MSHVPHSQRTSSHTSQHTPQHTAPHTHKPTKRLSRKKLTLHVVIILSLVVILVYVGEHRLTLAAMGIKIAEVLCDVLSDRFFPDDFWRS